MLSSSSKPGSISSLANAIQLHVYSPKSTFVQAVNYAAQDIFSLLQVLFGKVARFEVPYNMRELGTGMTSKALFITSDYDIAVYAVNKEQYSADAFLAFPIDVLGKEYYTGNFNFMSKCSSTAPTAVCGA